MRPRATLVLLALCLVAAAYVFLVERKHPTQEEVQEKEKALLALEPKDIRTVSIETNAGTIVCERQDSTQWVMRQPVEDKAENSAVEGVLSQLKALKADRVFTPEDSTLATFGLAHPAVVVMLQTSAGEHRLEVGDKSGTGDGYYARVDNEPKVGIVASYLVEGQLEKKASDFRDKRLTDFPLERARRVVLESSSGGRIEMTRDSAEGDWTIVSPSRLDADATNVNNVINRFRFLRARDFVDSPGPDEALGFNKPSVQLTVTLDDGTSHTLTLGRKEGDDVFARVSGRETVYRVPSTTQTDLAKGVGDLRDRRVMKFEPDDAVSLTLDTGGATVTAAKDSTGAWHFADQPARTAVKWRIEDPIRNLSLLRADSFVDSGFSESAAGLEHPQLVVTVTLKDGSRHMARFGSPHDKNVYASGERGPHIVLATTTAMTQFQSIVNARPYETESPASS